MIVGSHSKLTHSILLLQAVPGPAIGSLYQHTDWVPRMGGMPAIETNLRRVSDRGVELMDFLVRTGRRLGS